MLEKVLRDIEDELPDPLPWYSRFAIAVGRLTLLVGVFAVVFGLVTLAVLVVALVTGQMAIVYGAH
jgi:hypothetical protein